MNRRLGNIIISAAGGTAAKGAKTYKVTLPSKWISSLGLTEKNRQVELTFDGEKITIAPYKDISEFISQKSTAGHDIREIRYYDGKNISTVIYADFTDKTLRAENCTEHLIKTAFGKKELPAWDDLIGFLEERCIPRERAGLREYLETLGVDEYDPIEIIKKTAGRMAEDNQWIEMEASS